MGPTLGTDPEQVILGPNGQPTPAHLFFPRKEEAIDQGTHKVYRDGYMVEYEVKPSLKPIEVVDRVFEAQATASTIIPLDYKLISVPAVKVNLSFTKDKKTPGDMLMFGCHPSINAYTLEQTIPKIDAREHPWRYAGDHLHFGIHKHWPATSPTLRWFEQQEHQVMFIKLLDLHLGLLLTVVCKDSGHFERRKWYGKAGDFRFQYYDEAHYGVEYRSLGAGMVFQNYETAMWAFNRALEIFHSYETLAMLWPEGIEDDLQLAINTGHRAETLLDKWVERS